MENHTPSHPLPVAIQQMDPDETVCKYCGVSYLIHHEFKLMEEKVKAMEAEVEFYRGSVERERRLLVDLQTLNMRLEQYKTTSEQQSESLKVVSMQLAGKQTELKTIIGDMNSIENKLKEAEHQSQMFRSKYQEQGSALKKTLGFLQLMKKELTRVRCAVSDFSDIQRGFSAELLNRSRDAHGEITTLHESLGTSQTQITCLREQVRDLQSVATAAELKSQQLQTLVHGESQLQNKCHEMQKQTLDLNNQLKTLQLRLQKGTSEMEHYKQLFVSKSNENEDNLSRLRRHENERKEAESRRCEELRAKEEEWLACNQKCKYLQEQLSEKERKEEEISRRNSRLENENETLKTALKQAEEEVSTLKQERELAMLSHQSAIEQLRESFRQEMLEGDSWGSKVNEELSKERAQLSLGLHEAEQRLREEARMELDIERAKFQELIQKYQKEHKELQKKVPFLIRTATTELKEEISSLEKKLEGAQMSLTEKEDKKDQEIESLKKLVFELESQLKHEQNSVDCLTTELRHNKQQKSQKLIEINKELDQLTQESYQLQEENCLLQETVRRECEERFELTEALSHAREQLLELKRLSGELQISHRSLSQSNLVLSPPSASSQGQKGINTKSSGIETKRGGLTRLVGNAEIPSSTRLRSSGNELPTIPLPHPPRERASSMSEARHRIAAVMRRKENKM
ncbi:leucine-, glutamate- and lysine-rich protein 1-like isoform X1 [Polyodon spathula]|uniref:leucine-, glutamate- and lysine-rich protein 1-like isoform X1 n=1 Tax=Polyodon spathula TaxID=7913 RepID=UPI001B7EC2FE|nr:leucine-, glutamate- and lysine-rich protein 1-like isoform X1 [Polyodon spathula]XP_041120736.1 leucine-, glutamate- and lysine-rich protein 1-like isoform X1 [Polyodon spathula]